MHYRCLNQQKYDKLSDKEKYNENTRWDKDYYQNYHEYKKVQPTQPKNETYEHHLCKLAGYALAWNNFNCKYIEQEIELRKLCGDKNGITYNNKVFKNKDILDVVGVTATNYKGEVKTYGFEAKASKSDYYNGFGNQCDYTYIICPVDIIPKDEIPTNIGLIYVDTDFFFVDTEGYVHGCKIIKRARKRKHQVNRDINIIKEYINRANTVQNIFRCNLLYQYRFSDRRG